MIKLRHPNQMHGSARDISGQNFGRLTALLPTTTRRNEQVVWLCQCECGELSLVRLSNLTHDPTRSCGCIKAEQNRAKLAGVTGQDAPAWKGGKTDEYQLARTQIDYLNWRAAVYERDDYTCQKCNQAKSGKLNAHHILPFVQHPEFRTDVDNGITLCSSCHQDFHREYGKRYCDRVDLLTWVNDAIH